MSRAAQIREFLRKSDDGATSAVIAANTNIKADVVRVTLTKMPDTYIDRWQVTGRAGAMAAVWAVVVPPEDCPHPGGRIVARR